jgi:mevalonate kinase
MNAIEIVRLLDAIVGLAMSAGISLARYQAMKDASGGTLTDEQIQELAADAKKAVDRL